MVAKNDAIGDMIGKYVTESVNGTPEGMTAKIKEEMKKLGFSEEEVDTINLVVQNMYKSYQANREEEKKREEDKQRRDELIEKYGRSKGDKIFVKEQKQQAEAEVNARKEAERQRRADRARDPFAPIDDAISGVFISLGRGLGQTMKDITKTIEEGAKSAVDGVITAGKLAVAGVAWMVDEAVALGKSAKDAVSGWMSEDEKENRKQDVKKTETEKAKQDKVGNKDIGERLDKITKLASQKGDGYALEEIKKALKNIPGGDKLDAKFILSKSCNALTTWITLKEAGANVGEFGEFFEKQVKEKNIRAEDAYTGSPFKIASHYSIDGQKVDVGFTEDFNKYEQLLKSEQINHGEVYFKGPWGNHALSVYSSQGNIKMADVSIRTNGTSASEYVNAKKNNFKWFFM